ncbi:MAG: family 1 encapsulin nanocompartment shell protein [Sulfolobales archaeon]|nr:encapsulin [Sulfolobales archaeon]MCX8209138.1 encapsulin [Sulfolobales archaeon]MDW8010473.1 family 1 encapsulin nanocompartment shell protein [Sulfolobales archaeon]
MLSRHPLEVLKERKLGKRELAEALRLSIIAELDAINLYLQIADRVEDERYRKVFEDIAKEEKTHVGEFLALLKTLDEEQIAELAAGAREVEELTGLKVEDPPKPAQGSEVKVDIGPLSEEEWKTLNNAVREVLELGRIYRKHIPLAYVGRGITTVPKGTAAPELVKLEEISSRFKISLQDLDASRRLKSAIYLGPAQAAAYEVSRRENEYITKALTELGGVKIQMSDWSAPGKPVEDVAKAIAELLKAGNVPPFTLFVSPSRYAKLVAIYERTGVMELTRVKALVKDVVSVPELPDNVALLVATNPSVVDLVIGADSEVEFIGPENGFYLYRIWGTTAVRVKNSAGVAVLRE